MICCYKHTTSDVGGGGGGGSGHANASPSQEPKDNFNCNLDNNVICEKTLTNV